MLFCVVTPPPGSGDCGAAGVLRLEVRDIVSGQKAACPRFRSLPRQASRVAVWFGVDERLECVAASVVV